MFAAKWLQIHYSPNTENKYYNMFMSKEFLLLENVTR